MRLEAVNINDMAILLNTTLSDNIGETPEGFLICKNVPVARVGVQYYSPSELGLPGRFGEKISVYREPEDVFDANAMRSLESKAVTEDHPSEDVTIHNSHFLSKGHGRNARQMGDYLVADLVITDPLLKDKILKKAKYSISLGYTANFKRHKDGFKQKDIKINHIAVVEQGRAGKNVKIQDHKRRNGKMRTSETVKKIMDSLKEDSDFTDKDLEQAKKLLDGLSVQQEPTPTPAPQKESILEKAMAFMMMKSVKDESEEKKAEDEEGEKKADDSVTAQIKALTDAVTLMAVEIKKLKDEKEGSEDEADLIEDVLKEDVEDEDEDEDKKAADAASFTQLLKAVKPSMALMKPSEQKALKDALRQFNPVPAKKSDAYQGILNAAKAKRVGDTDKPTNVQDIGRKIAESRNPHYMKKPV